MIKNSQKKYPYVVYIGAGVSTQYGVLHLLKNGYPASHITIIEKGNDIYKRKPSEVMNGAGGAGTFSDFKILKSFNSGGQFTPKYVLKEKALELSKIFIDYVKHFHPDPDKIQYTYPETPPKFILDSDFKLKQDPVMHLGTDYGREQVKNIFEYFDKMGVKQYYNSELEWVDEDEKGNKYVIFNQEINEDGYVGVTQHKIYTDKVIFAMGKSGVDFLKDFIKIHNLETEPRPAQIGVRFESEGEYFKDITNFAYDFKLYKKYDNISSRSFCVNNNAAFVAPEKTYNKITFNGHAYKDKEKYNGLTNFGIMLEIKDEIDNPFEFQRQLVDFFNKDGKAAYYSPNGRIPTKDDEGNDLPLYKVNKNEIYKGYGNKYASIIFDFIDKLEEMFPINGDYILYIPEVKYVTNYLKINNKNFSIPKLPWIQVQGDIAMSRGIFISSLSGMYVAESLLNN